MIQFAQFSFLFVKEPIAMGIVQEIQHAIRDLSPAELADFHNWFAEFDYASWDRQVEADAAAGRLDRLAEEALRELQTQRATDL
jgi:hypothetical protein